MSTPQVRTERAAQKRIQDLPRTTVVAETDTFAVDTADGTKSVTQNDLFANGGRMRWVYPYVQGNDYKKNDVVRVGHWTMIANKDTAEYPAPMPSGDPSWLLPDEPTWEAQQANASQIATALVGTFETTGYLLATRAWIPVASSDLLYRIDILDLTDPDNPIEHHGPAFIATETGWTTVDVPRILLDVGTKIGAKLISQNTASQSTFQGTWDYTTPQNETIPAAGQIVHAHKALSTLRIAKTDADAVDRSADLLTIGPGDTISPGTTTWTATGQATDGGSYVDVPITPFVQTTAGTYAFVFTIHGTQDVDYVRLAGHWATEPNIDGELTVGSTSTVVTQDAYGIDLRIQNATVPQDWDLVATSSGTGGEGDGDTGEVPPHGPSHDSEDPIPKLEAHVPDVTNHDNVPSFAGNAGKAWVVNGTEDGVAFEEIAGGGGGGGLSLPYWWTTDTSANDPGSGYCGGGSVYRVSKIDRNGASTGFLLQGISVNDSVEFANAAGDAWIRGSVDQIADAGTYFTLTLVDTTTAGVLTQDEEIAFGFIRYIPKVHADLTERDAADSHPASAVTGVQEHIDDMDNPHEVTHAALPDLATSGHAQTAIGGRGTAPNLATDQNNQDARIDALESVASTVDSVAALKALPGSSLKDGLRVGVRGYYAPYDDGGGVFQYDSSSTATDDGGSVISPNSGIGRYLRVDDDEPKAEWFGAKGDATISGGTGSNDANCTGTDDHDALQACLTTYGRCHLLKKVYGIGPGTGATPYITPQNTNIVVTGENQGESMLAMLDGDYLYNSTAPHYMFYLRDIPRERAEFRNFGIYLNQKNANRLDGGLKGLCFLETNAANVHCEDLSISGYGRAATGGECFVFNAWGTTSGQVVYRRITFLGQADDSTSADDSGAEVTHLLAQFRENVLIADNQFNGLRRTSGKYGARQHFISFHGCNGVRCTGNHAEDSDGIFIYVDNGTATNCVVQGNTCGNFCGVFMYVTNSFGSGRFVNFDVSGNTVQQTPSATSVVMARAGIICEAWQGRNTKNFYGWDVHDNVFEINQDGQNTSAYGIMLRCCDHSNDTPVAPGADDYAYKRFTIRDNVFDVPGWMSWWAFPADSLIPQLNNPLAILGTPKNIFSQDEPNDKLNVQVHGNTSPAGLRIMPWGYYHDPAVDGFEPSSLTANNTRLGYAADQRETGYLDIEQGRLWQQFGDMATVVEQGFSGAFWLFGKGTADATNPGPYGRNTSFYFGMNNRSSWAVILPYVAATGSEGAAGWNQCDQWHELEMTWFRPGHVVKVLGYVDNGATLAEIGEFTVPSFRSLTIQCRPNRSTNAGKPSWDVQTNQYVLFGDLTDNVLPKSSGGVLVDGPFNDNGTDVVVNDRNVRHSSVGTNTLGTLSVPWHYAYLKGLRLTNLPTSTAVNYLGINSNGDVIPTALPGGGGDVSGSGSAGYLAQWDGTKSIASSILQNILGTIVCAGPFEPDGNATRDIGRSGVRWRNLYADDGIFTNTVRLGIGQQSALATDANGNIVAGVAGGGGNVTSSGGTAKRLAQFTADGVNIGNGPITDTGTDIVFDLNIRQGSTASNTCGTLATPWHYVYTKGLRLTNLPTSTAVNYLGINSNGDVIPTALPGSGGGDVTGSGTSGTLAVWNGTKSIADSLLKQITDTLYFDGTLRPAANGSAALGTQTERFALLYALSLNLTGTGVMQGARLTGLTSKAYLATDASGNIVEAETPSGGSGNVSTAGGTITRLAMFTGSTVISDAPISYTGSTGLDGEIVANVGLRGSSAGVPSGTAAQPWSWVYSRGVRISNYANQPYLKTNENGDIVGTTAPATTHGAARGNGQWANASGVALTSNGNPQTWPSMTQKDGYDASLSGSTWTVTNAGLYLITLNACIDNVGDASSGAKDVFYFRFDNLSDGYEVLFAANSGADFLTPCFSATRAVYLSAGGQVELGYRWTTPNVALKVYATNTSIIQTA